MSNISSLPKYPPHLEALFQQLDPPTAKLIFAVDAMAAKLMAEMFWAVAANGGLELQLIHYRGERECTASRWMSDAHALTTAISGVICAAGPTQIGRDGCAVKPSAAREQGHDSNP